MVVEDQQPTLLRPPEPDANRAPIENVLEVTEMKVLGDDIFTNTRRPWLPAGARGIYGGVVIAQCLASAQKTVPDEYLVHSCHCYFLLAGQSDVPILFHVERVRDGRSYVTRTVQARQKGRCIFTTTISFVREHSGGQKLVQHAVPLPPGVEAPDDAWDGEPAWARQTPFQTYRVAGQHPRDESKPVHERRVRQWIRARGRISAGGGHQAHLNALAYMSDSGFIGTVSRIHGLWRLGIPPEQVAQLEPAQQRQVDDMAAFDGVGATLDEWKARPRLGMEVSLDHSIYFHEPRGVRADEWMFADMEAPWAGDGRGVVTQRIFNKHGVLVASCVQEGVVRLTQDHGPKKASKL